METISGKPTPAHAYVNEPYEYKAFPTALYRTVKTEHEEATETKIVDSQEVLDASLADGWRRTPKD